jgi:hypothetical protein
VGVTGQRISVENDRAHGLAPPLEKVTRSAGEAESARDRSGIRV